MASPIHSCQILWDLVQPGEQPVTFEVWLPRVDSLGSITLGFSLGGAVGLVLGDLRLSSAFPDQGLRPAAWSMPCLEVVGLVEDQGQRSRSQRWDGEGRHVLESPHGLGSLDSMGVALSSLGNEG